MIAPAVISARTAVAVAFTFAGIGFGALASRIPDTRDALGLTPGRLGLTLLAISAGSVLALPAAGWVTQRIGVARSVATGAVLVATGLVWAGLSIDVLGSAGVLAVGLFLVGAGTGTWDVAMNLEGAQVERRMGRTVLPKFHAAFSLGTVAGAGIGALAVWSELPIWVHMVLVAVVLVPSVLAAVRRFLADPPDAPQEADAGQTPTPAPMPAPAARRHPLAAWTEGRTLLIGVVVLAAAFTEGVANDWLSVALVDGYDLPTWVGVLGLAAFLSAMTVGRVVGSPLLDRYGRVPVLLATLSLAGLGSLLVVFGGSAPVAFVGAVLWGLGASLGFPVGMSAAADDPQHAAARVSVVASIGYTAFLAGPPLLGFLGDHVGVLRALVVVSVLIVPALLVVPAVRRPPLQATASSAREQHV